MGKQEHKTIVFAASFPAGFIAHKFAFEGVYGLSFGGGHLDGFKVDVKEVKIAKSFELSGESAISGVAVARLLGRGQLRVKSGCMTLKKIAMCRCPKACIDKELGIEIGDKSELKWIVCSTRLLFERFFQTIFDILVLRKDEKITWHFNVGRERSSTWGARLLV